MQFIFIPIAWLVLFLIWTVLPILLPRDRLGTWLTAAHLAASVTALLLAWLTDVDWAELAVSVVFLGGFIAAMRLLLQRAFADSRG
ncbi:hypothetical protein ACWFRJ_34530 [Streptomyces sp. NPDC055239]